MYILFDTVRFCKCVCNDWIHIRNNQKTFDFPDITDKNTILVASFSHFKVMYNMEHTSLVKLNYNLLHPHNIEGQNVTLVSPIFCKSTAATLQTVGPQNEQLPNWGRTLVFATILNFLTLLIILYGETQEIG